MNKFSVSSEKDLAFFFKKNNFKKIFILSGKNSFNLSGIKNILFRLLKKKRVMYYFKTSYYPEFFELKKIINAINNFKPDLIVVAGGGSVMDYGKIANLLEINDKLDKQIINSSYKIKKNKAKLVAIPTTAGSGAEVTPSAVIYIDKKKYSVEHEKIKPDYFFLIPKLLFKSSKQIKSSAGFDAISQAMESLISKKSNAESINYAKKSLQISLKYYLEFIKKTNKENSEAMSYAANLSGRAISFSKTIAPHAVSYPFTSIYNISHGHAVSLTLNKFLKFNYENIEKSKCNFDLKKRYEIIFSLTGSKNIIQLDEFIKNLKKRSNLVDNYKKLGINIRRDYSRILSGVNIMRLSNNPIELKKIDVKNILLK